MDILVLYARVKLPNELSATGPVTTQDFQEFLFRNTGSDLDLYFTLKKDNGKWVRASFGPSIPIPTSIIEQVGQQIDQELVLK